jgi:hypothetical protein
MDKSTDSATKILADKIMACCESHHTIDVVIACGAVLSYALLRVPDELRQDALNTLTGMVNTGPQAYKETLQEMSEAGLDQLRAMGIEVAEIRADNPEALESVIEALVKDN